MNREETLSLFYQMGERWVKDDTIETDCYEHLFDALESEGYQVIKRPKEASKRPTGLHENSDVLLYYFAHEMLRVQLFPDTPLDNLTLFDFIEMLDEEESVAAGILFADGKGYNSYSDIRGDEIDDGKALILVRAIKAALSKANSDV